MLKLQQEALIDDVVADPALLVRSLENAAMTLHAASCFRPEEDFIRYALDNSAIVAVTDVRGTITYVNNKFCEISGYTEPELIGSNHRMLKSGQHETSFFREMYREIAKGRIWHGEICNRRKDGSLYWVDTTIVPRLSRRGKAESYTSIRFDVTARKQLEVELRASKEHLRRIANLDPLTDLPNRRCFQEHLETTVAECAEAGRRFHLALLDVDTFKEINDSFGHPAGDELLRTVASRLSSIRSDGFISRLGGDEFGILLTDALDSEATAFFEEVLEAIREPIRVGVTSRRCSASLGVAVFPGDSRDADNLFKAADLALYHAKELGRDRFELFQPKLRDVAERRSRILLEIEHSLQLGAFELHYQPIVRVTGEAPLSLEALMRWRHPQRGLLAPSAFLEGFSDPAVRATLGMFTLEQVFKDVSEFVTSRMPLQRIAINLTNSDFRSDGFTDRFFELLSETGVPPERFCVEVAEGMFLGSDHKRVEQGLLRLHKAGVEIALDDFGTGYASLTHLRQLPFDRLKIDRSFVANMVYSKRDQSIVRGIVDIAHSLGKVVTAEGVETIEQVELLCEMGCDHLQGWYFGKACPPAVLPHAIAALPTVNFRVSSDRHGSNLS